MTDSQQQYNLDDVREYFEFKVKGHVYRFRYITTEEGEKMKDLKDGEIQDYFLQFITKVDESSPDFKEVQKTMTIAQWKQFRKMIEAEFSTT